MKRICVYCGAKPGNHPQYQKAADDLGTELVKRGLGLVYGGGSTGLMGQIANSVVNGGGEAIGIIPQSLAMKEFVHSELGELKVVDSMHQRKALMEQLADGFIAMPGGFGTLEELLEILTWSQLKFHKKPCAVLNVGNYYAPLAALLNHAVEEGFIKTHHRNLLISDEDPARLLHRMEEFAEVQGGANSVA